MSLESQVELQPVDNRIDAHAHNERRSFMDIWRVFMKQRFTIIAITVLSVTAAAWYAFHTLPLYEAIAHIQIKQNTLSNDALEGYWAGIGEDAEMQSEIVIMKSDSVLFQTAQSLHLIDRIRPIMSESNNIVSSSEITPAEHRRLVGIIKNKLFVTLLPNTQIIEIRYRNNDPKLAAAVVNQLMETYSDEEIRTKYERTMHVSVWLQKRMEDLKQEASATQQQLADYQRIHNIVGTDEHSNLTLQTLEHVSGALDDAEADRIIKEARMHEFEVMSPDMTTLMSDDPALAATHSQLNELEGKRTQLATKLGPKHPQMQALDLQIKKVRAQTDMEIETARRLVRSEYESALAAENALRKRLGSQEDTAYRLNEDVAQYAILRHEAELTRNLYDTLQTKLKEASVTAGMDAANITVVDRADIPSIPVAPKKGKILLLGLVAGLVLGCVLSFVIESIDDRLRTSEEVESASSLPSLAAIPHIVLNPGKHREEREALTSGMHLTLQPLITLSDPQSSGAEAYRSMRSSLLLSSIDHPPRVIVVTSSFPGEGKTTTAINLSIVLAQRNEKVLLVDADLRRGSLHRVFGMVDQGLGLSAALAQPEQQQELPVPLSDLPMLHVLATGPRPPNPAEMLSSNRMAEQIQQWTQQFDRIVIDTAPVLAVSDTQALAVHADAVVLVARAGVTRKRALIRARDLLWRVNAPVVGVVVNDVDLRLENFYTYHYNMSTKDYWYGYKEGAVASSRAYGYENEKTKA